MDTLNKEVRIHLSECMTAAIELGYGYDACIRLIQVAYEEGTPVNLCTRISNTMQSIRESHERSNKILPLEKMLLIKHTFVGHVPSRLNTDVRRAEAIAVEKVFKDLITKPASEDNLANRLLKYNKGLTDK